MSERADRPHVVYRLYGARRVLLYVGMTADVETVTFPSESLAREAETQAIRAENPRYNSRGFGPTFTSRFRVARHKWEGFDRAAAEAGTDRAKLVNDFIAWFNREPGARLPKRPDPKA